ncbi:MAG: LysR substrate-binding domain-containing protein [Thermoanaerobaculia bacterium]
MELRHLRYFVAVAEELHFGHAAARLHISQPPLSQQIQDLERELGVELFIRTRRSVALTAAGRVFLEEARHVLGDAKHAVEIAKKASRGEIGRLSIGFGPAPEAGLLKRVLTVFLARHPDVDVELHRLYTQEQLKALSRETIDVAFPLLPIPAGPLVVERVSIEPVAVAMSSLHPLAGRRRLALQELRHEPFVLVCRDVGPVFYDLLFDACGKAGFTPTVTHETRHVMTVLGFVAAGLGVTLLPGAVESSAPPGVVFRRISPHTPTVALGIAYRRSDTSQTVSAFVEVVREVVRQRTPRPGWESASA